jgi:orotate phosphoribosyltransferase-like protein
VVLKIQGLWLVKHSNTTVDKTRTYDLMLDWKSLMLVLVRLTVVALIQDFVATASAAKEVS